MKKALMVCMLLLSVVLSGCVEDDIESTSERDKGGWGNHWYNLINPDLIKVNIYDYNGTINAPHIISYGRTVILYNFTVEGFRKALNCSDEGNHIFIDLPDRTMDIYGLFNDSIFTIDNDNVTIRGQGVNIDSFDEYGEPIFVRSEIDSIFRVFNDSGGNCPVLIINGDNCVVSGIHFYFMFNDSNMIPMSMSGDSIVIDNFVSFEKPEFIEGGKE